MNKIHDIKTFILEHKKVALIAVVVAIIAIAVIVVVAMPKDKSQNKKEETSKTETETTTVQEETTTAKEEPKEDPMKGKMYSYLTGEPVKNKIGTRRPVAVMYNNIIDAIPHSGISGADIVYEATVEGGLTRLMGIFENYDKLDRLGSVRSSRLYYAHWAAEFDAIYCHFGQSGYALDFLNSDKIDNLSGLEGVGNVVYFRSDDRYAPHNAFATPDGIQAGIEQKGYREKYEDDYKGNFNFVEYGTELELKDGTAATNVQLNYSINYPSFKYNKNKKNYTRYQYGEKHMDDLNNKAVTCKNIIIQYCDYQLFGDGKSLDMYHVGSGKGMYITNGKAVEITWKKKNDTAPTKYYDKKGNEITMNTGKTWICVIPESVGVVIS